MGESNHYQKLMEMNKGYIDAFDALYKLNTNEEDQLNKIFEKIKINLIESKICTPSYICKKIITASMLNIRYYSSYMSILKNVCNE